MWLNHNRSKSNKNIRLRKEMYKKKELQKSMFNFGLFYNRTGCKMFGWIDILWNSLKTLRIMIVCIPFSALRGYSLIYHY